MKTFDFLDWTYVILILMSAGFSIVSLFANDYTQATYFLVLQFGLIQQRRDRPRG